MLKAAYLAIAVWALLGSVSWGQSQEPPRQNRDSAQQHPETNQRGTEQSPFIIQIQPPYAQEKAETSRKDGPNEWFYGWTLSDRIAAVATIAAFLQFLALAGTIGVLLLTARRQLRAYVYPDNAGLYEGMMLTPPIPQHANEPGATQIWRNTGQTPALRVVSWGQLEVIEPINEDKLIVPPLQDVYFNNLGAGGTADLPLNFHPAAIRASAVDTPFGAV